VGYTVQAGDTLAKIAKTQGVDGGWQELHAANLGTVPNPNAISVGQQLVIPA
jgi:LysM repeat protein